MINALINLATNRRVTVFMLALTMLLFGSIAIKEMSVTLLPDLQYPTFTVRTDYANAGPEEIELLITKPVEETVGVIKGLSRVYSVSSTGRSDVKLELNWDADIKQAAYEIRDRIDSVRLPLDAQPPVLLRFNPSTAPIMQVVLTLLEQDDDLAQLKQLRTFTEQLFKKKLEPVTGVAAVKISGGLEQEIQIEPDQYKLAQLGLSVGDVSLRLRQENINLSGGAIKQGTQLYLVRTVNQFQDLTTIKDIVISIKDSKPIRIRDIANVSLYHKDRNSINRLDGKEAIEIAIYKEGDANTVEVAENIKQKLKELESILPKNAQLEIINDQSEFISDAIGNVVTAAIIGGILAVLVIYLFLQDIRATMVIATLIPVSVIAGFFLMYQAGVSFNIMSLGGIALAIGLLVDNGIVVLENIASKRKAGLKKLAAVQQGTREVGSAIVASTLTTIAVFLPLVFVKGIAGQLFKDQALTVTFTLIVSLFIALTLVPMLMSIGSKKTFSMSNEDVEYKPKTRLGAQLRKGRKFLLNTVLDKIIYLIKAIIKLIALSMRYLLLYPSKFINLLFNALAKIYQRLLPWSLRHRMIVLGLTILIFILSIMMIPKLGMNLIPDLDANTVKVNFKLAEGVVIEKTDETIQKLSTELNQLEAIKFVYGIGGQGAQLDVSALSAGENSGQLLIRTKAGANKSHVQQQVLQILNAQPGLNSELQAGEFFELSNPIEIELSGFDIELLKQQGRRLRDALIANKSFINVDDGLSPGNPEIQIYFDQERIAMLGLTNRQVANVVVDKVLGKSETTVHWQDQKIAILVRNPLEQRNSIQSVSQLLINPQSNNPITLGDVAEIKIAQGPGQILRRDQDRVVVITADIVGIDLAQAVTVAKDVISQTKIHPLVVAKVTGQNKDLQESNNSMIFALVLAIFLVYMVLASQFESFIHPFVILFSIPLAMIGAIWALYLSNTQISVVVFIGLIMLAGIVVNNAIVLIGKIKQLQELGASLHQALIEAGNARLRPIIMTTVTTVLGLLPMVVTIVGNQSAGAEIRAPMAITVIGGLIVSTFLTLIVVPVIYSLVTKDTVVQK
ncbi:RND efflux system, inner membrane transporter [hydrothermal vent metagenome]|uniref:RND efflux system, inner membrane transporter n=1 Tax=hydrothermal vent metagenome TaxID=652676 RepID=A0A3B0UPP9_9ZZZZ